MLYISSPQRLTVKSNFLLGGEKIMRCDLGDGSEVLSWGCLSFAHRSTHVHSAAE